MANVINWFAIAGIMYMACAFGLVIKAQTWAGVATDGRQRARADASRHVDAMFAVPFFAVGVIALLAGQFSAGVLSPTMIVLMLSAPMALLLYLGYEGLWVEGMLPPAPAEGAVQRPMLRLPSPDPIMPAPSAGAVSHAHLNAQGGAQPNGPIGKA